MTREQAKEILPIIEAFSKGKTVERFNPGNGEWEELKNPSFDLDNSFYRIKPEPKYRPFKNQKECWEEMLKHQPFGWIKNDVGNIFNIIAIFNQNHTIKLNECYSKYSDLFKDFKFTDGTPFGIKKDI